MFKFIKPGTRGDSEARVKLQKELFAFQRTVTHGFPHRPSALAFDPVLRIMAIGTKEGSLCVYGQPGVEFSVNHDDCVAVMQLFFVPGKGRLVTLLEDNTLHLWQVETKNNKCLLTETRSFSLDRRLTKISACCLPPDGRRLFLGTEGGNVYVLGLNDFKLLDQVIYQDIIVQSLASDCKVLPGAVESIETDPSSESRLLIGYNRGLVVVWSCEEGRMLKHFVSSQQLESLSWHRSGSKFMSAHNDGSYTLWKMDSDKANAPLTPYGPYPCKAIKKLVWLNTDLVDDEENYDDEDEDEPEPLMLFSGGMPRASYGDRHTVTVKKGDDEHVVFDFSSRIVDFFHVGDAENGLTTALVVLAEEEIVAIDLQSEGWPVFRSPYLSCIHSSAITCSQHVADVPSSFWDKLHAAGEGQLLSYSSRPWPVDGGRNVAPPESATTPRDVLITGHEDGTVMFWEAGGVAMRLVYKLGTAPFYSEGELPPADSEEDEWPPFRKVGSFDPYSDDPRLGVQKIVLCPLSGTLVVAGTAGQMAILKMSTSSSETTPKSGNVNIVSDRESFVWKGHSALTPSPEPLSLLPGFQPSCLLQLSPPASITALALHAQWQVIAVGTAHGFTLFDYVQAKEVITKCTLNPNHISANNDSAMSRRKSFKKSLRESFRRLRKRRSKRRGSGDSPTPGHKSPPAEKRTTYPRSPPSPSPADAVKPVERAIEARGLGVTEDGMGSMVRVLQFAQTFLASGQSHTPTLWVGTNQGTIFVFQIMLPAGSKRDSIPVQCHLGKEVQLKHHAPVISITILDAQLNPLPAPLMVENNRAKPADMSSHHKVLICSEEQFKIFTLPSLKQFNKLKLTAVDGSRLRKINVVEFRSRSDNSYYEHAVCCLTNQGELCVFSIPQLRRQLAADCLKREDILGISSTLFTKNGQGFYLLSPSEFKRFSVSARNVTDVKCVLEIAEEARPKSTSPSTPPPEPTTPSAGSVDNVVEADESDDERDADGGGAAASGGAGGPEAEAPGGSAPTSDDPDAGRENGGGKGSGGGSGSKGGGNGGGKDADADLDDFPSTPPTQRVSPSSSTPVGHNAVAIQNVSLSSSFNASAADETLDSVRDFPLNLTSSTAQPINSDRITEEEADNAANEAADLAISNGPVAVTTNSHDDVFSSEPGRRGESPTPNGVCIRGEAIPSSVATIVSGLTLAEPTDGDTSGDSGLSSETAVTPAMGPSLAAVADVAG